MKLPAFVRHISVFSGLLLLALSFAALIAPLSVSAQDPDESITLSPVRKSFTVNPGQTVSETLTVLNDGKTAYNFTVYATPYSVTNGTYEPNFTATPANADAYTWVQFEKTTYRAEPRQTVTIPYTMKVREDAAPGGHYGAIFVEILPDDSEKGSIVVHKRISSLLYATVSGTAKLSGLNTGSSIAWFQSHPPLSATTSIENTGNSDFAAKVNLTVKSTLGTTKYSETKEYSILPNTTRDIEASWAGASWLGLYRATISTEVLGEVTSTSSYVLIVPFWLILLLIISSIGGGIYAYIFQHKKQEKASSHNEKHSGKKL